MSLSALIQQHGYWIVFVGALAEGETVLLLAGFAAHRGLLSLPEVMALAFVAGMLGDQFWFYLGRRHGAWLFERFPSVQTRAQRLRPLLHKHPNVAILGLRFLYGLRTAGPLALGALGVSRRRFVLLNMLGAALWAGAFTLLGWQFGNAMQWLLPDLRRAEEGLLIAGGVAALAWAALRRARRGMARNKG